MKNVHKQSKPQTPAERYEHGKSLRKLITLEQHAEWSPSSKRLDPVTLLEGQNQDRITWLIPMRRARMSVSPFTFYRGAARIMAADLATTPNSGLMVQICGDAHISNFGGYASPERKFVFDLNDFDETLPGPWEWDVKRLAVSFYIAGRYNGCSRKASRKLCNMVTKSYRKSMIKFAGMRLADIWYSLIDADDIMEAAQTFAIDKQVRKKIKKAKRKDHRHVLDQLAEKANGKYQIKSDPPLLVPFRDITAKKEHNQLLEEVKESYRQYLENAPDDVAHLLKHYTPVDFAIKIVGVGSVGTRCSIMMLEGRDEEDPFFLQIKEANPSVLEEFLPKSRYENAGQRVVEGQRLMQSVSDVFLGWTTSETTGHHYYWRQLKDWKGSLDTENTDIDHLRNAAKIRGKVLANAHARSGDPIAISGYLGDNKDFDKAITQFSEQYSAQNDADYEQFLEKINSGKLEVADEF